MGSVILDSFVPLSSLVLLCCAALRRSPACRAGLALARTAALALWHSRVQPHCRTPAFFMASLLTQPVWFATLASVMFGKAFLNNVLRFDAVQLQKSSDCSEFRVICEYSAFAKLYRC